MSIYKVPISTAFLIFPFIAFLLTLPFLIYQYRKYGSIPLLRSVIFYSFILYLMCAYFLVILPLPSLEEVEVLKTPITQLIPFNFIIEITQLPWDFSNISTIFQAIKEPVFYIAAFNLLLTLPLGIYLRYYFECSWKKTLCIGFFLSLFFELTQLTGLYGIYPRPYRLFDVDDLILNSLGTMIGFWITPLFSFILPSRKELDEKSLKKGQKVAFFRRALAFLIDLFFVVLICVVILLLLYDTSITEYSFLITLVIYYLILPIVFNGKTLGKMILKLQIVSKKETKWTLVKIELRYLLAYILFYYQIVIIELINNLTFQNDVLEIVTKFSIIVLEVYFIFNIISIVISIFKKDKEFLYEKITNTKTISTIEYEKKEEKEQNNKEGENVRVKKDK